MTARTRAPRMDPEKRREQILGAARAAFGRDGYEGTRIEDVAARAGVAKALVLRYWDSKEALFLDLRRRIHEEIRAEALAAAAEPTPAEAVAAIVDAIVGYHARHPTAQTILLPVPSLPSTHHDDAGASIVVVELLGIDRFTPFADLVPIAVEAAGAALRGAILAMHAEGLDPDVVRRHSRAFVLGAVEHLLRASGRTLPGIERVVPHLAGGGPPPPPPPRAGRGGAAPRGAPAPPPRAGGPPPRGPPGGAPPPGGGPAAPAAP